MTAGDEGALFGVDDLAALTQPSRRGRIERALAQSVAAGRRAQVLQDVDGGMVAAALSLARHLDSAEAVGGVKGGYLAAQLGRPFQDALESLGLAGRGVPTSGDAAKAGDPAGWASEFGPSAT